MGRNDMLKLDFFLLNFVRLNLNHSNNTLFKRQVLNKDLNYKFKYCPIKIKVLKRVLIRIGVCDLDVELSYHICAGAYILERSVRPIITYMIRVKIDESQIGFYLKFLVLNFSTK